MSAIEMKFQAASDRLRRVGSKNAASAEAEYAVAYAALVKVGVRPRLRGKYRP